jgi:hypothetical protein
MSETLTPRTDDEEISPRLDIEVMIVSSDFARQLERELAEAREQRNALAKGFDAAQQAILELGKQRDTLTEALDTAAISLRMASSRHDEDRGTTGFFDREIDLIEKALAAVKGDTL